MIHYLPEVFDMRFKSPIGIANDIPEADSASNLEFSGAEIRTFEPD